MTVKHLSNTSNSHPEVFLGTGVLKICSKFTEEHPCRSVISIKLLCNFIEITLRHGCPPVNFLYIWTASSEIQSNWIFNSKSASLEQIMKVRRDKNKYLFWNNQTVWISFQKENYRKDFYFAKKNWFLLIHFFLSIEVIFLTKFCI